MRVSKELVRKEVLTAKSMSRFACLLLYVFFLCNTVLLGDVVHVREQGANGDALRCDVEAVSNSNIISLQGTNQCHLQDLGKVIMLYGAGVSSTGTNHQDYLGKIVGVPDKQHLSLSKPLGISATNLHGIYGTDNATAFQRCVDRAYGTNTVIMVPPGNYLMIPPDLMNQGYEMKGDSETRAAVVIQKGGITFRGNDSKTTMLTACGAWQLKGKHVSRGVLFECRGPIRSPENPLVFENLTFDGGVSEGLQSYRGFPARCSDGDGWDVTHDAVIDLGHQPLHAHKTFHNCIFQHWRGEILKGCSGDTNGFIEVTGCDFHDGNASAFNFDVAHHIDHCTFSHLDMAMEFYEGRMDRPSCFENSTVFDVRNDLVIVGALTNQPAPLYTIKNNSLQSKGGIGVFINPAKNLLIESNQFEGQGFAIGNGAGYQGTDCNRDIVIRGNRFTHVQNALLVMTEGSDRMENITVVDNLSEGGGCFGSGYGWSTNVLFSNNIAMSGSSGVWSRRLKGQWFRDDFSNRFPPHKIPDNLQNAVISYADGARDLTSSARTEHRFSLDDSQPAKIPPEARLQITHQGPLSAPLFLSSTHPAQKPDAMLLPGKVTKCAWMNGSWRVEVK